MNQIKFPLLLFALLSIIACKPKTSESVEYPEIPVTYPVTRQDTISDDYFGTLIQDPYRWLEDDNSAETKEWVKQQNVVTNGYLSQIPFREKIRERLSKIINFERFSAPVLEGGKYYFLKNDGLQNQSVLYSQDTPDSDPEMILDPNTFSADGSASLAAFKVSSDGSHLAYAVSEGGSDWWTIKVMQLSDKSMKSDEVKWVKFSSILWTADGFYYSRFPASEEGGLLSGANEFHQVWFHKLGTSQDADVLVYKDEKNAQMTHFADLSSDKKFLIVSGAESTSGNSLKVKDLSRPDAPFITVVDNFNNDYQFIDQINGLLYFLTNHEAPNQRVIAIDPKAPSESNWKEIIPASEDVLSNVTYGNQKLVALYISKAASALKIFDLGGKAGQDVKLPGIGTIGELQADKDQQFAFFSFTEFTRPTSIYKLDISNGSTSIFKAPVFDFPSDDYETRQVTYKSKDGTDVTMFLVNKKGQKMDTLTPVWLYGYGGFNISVMPRFWVGRIPFLENGGVMAIANIRGGGEKGKEWHSAGTLGRKQNVFDDFIAAAEYLIAEGLTSKEKIAIEGGSNGGLLVGACMTQRPDLFKVAIPRVGVLDMLRYHLFTIGWAWATDYGKSDEQEAFNYLIKYSPIHNVKETTYPATIVVTADHDDRVVPAHSFKFIAALQAKQQGNVPVLARIETSAGHGAGKPVSKIIEEETDILSFMFYNLQHPVKY
jgi:prolyl oligopeptidase